MPNRENQVMTSTSSERPTTSVERVLLDSMDDMAAQLVTRLGGLGEAEYLWEPVPDCWSVRVGPDGAVADLGDRDADPAPMTTIAWRLWHLASDCFAIYTARFRGEPFEDDDLAWTLDPVEAVRRFEASWSDFRSVLTGHDDWFAELGPGFGPWHRHCVADFAMHASNELVHHGAEIALLRDLYRGQS